MIEKAIINAFKKKEQRGWDKWPRMFWAIDLHDVIIPGTYTLNNSGRELYPHAGLILRWLTNRKDMCMILFTSSHKESIDDILGWLKKQEIVFDYVNENPECPNNDLCDFSKKLYFDVMLEDKAGFDGLVDWKNIMIALKDIGEWDRKYSHSEYL